MELDSTTLDQINKIKERCQAIKPLVVIRCITYNHEPYIKDALEGFLMQKTDFPFVAIVHDDASTDNTAGIVREYAEKYPDIIFPIFETKNQYSKRDGSLGEIMKTAQDATGAKYIAFCEGDDYWTDPLKLQKQVDFLESHPDYGISVTACTRHYQRLGKFSEYKVEGEITFNILLKGNCIHTPSVVVRKQLLNNYYSSGIKEEVKVTSMGDYQQWLWLSVNSKVYYLQDITTVYRVLQKSASHGSYIEWLNFVIDSIKIRKFFAIRYCQKQDMQIEEIVYNLVKANYLKDKNEKRKIQSSAKLLDSTNLSSFSKLIKLMVIYLPQSISFLIKWKYRQDNYPSRLYRTIIKCCKQFSN